MVIVIGWIALIVTLIYTCLGLGMQLVNNYRRRSTAGISPCMVVTLLCTFLSWTVYGCVCSPPDVFIILPNIIGSCCATLLLWQSYAYR